MRNLWFKSHTNSTIYNTRLFEPNKLLFLFAFFFPKDVNKSDLKTIKQSAVKMSVGQKHQASQILKDWLDDGNKEDSENNEQVEESK